MLDHIELVYDGDGKRGEKRVLVKFFTANPDVTFALYDDDLRDMAERFSRYTHGRLKPCVVSSPCSEPGRPGYIAVYVSMDAPSHAVVFGAISKLLDYMDPYIGSARRIQNGVVVRGGYQEKDQTDDE